MAKFSVTSVAVPPLNGRNHRVNGTVYQLSPTTSGSEVPPRYASNQVVTWVTPNGRPTPRFELINKKIRILDSQFDDLPAGDKDLWEATFDLNFWQLVCLIRKFNLDPLSPEQTED